MWWRSCSLTIDVEFYEIAVRPEARVVDHEIDRPVVVGEASFHLGELLGVGQISGKDLHIDLIEFGGE